MAPPSDAVPSSHHVTPGTRAFGALRCTQVKVPAWMGAMVGAGVGVALGVAATAAVSVAVAVGAVEAFWAPQLAKTTLAKTGRTKCLPSFTTPERTFAPSR